MSNAFSHHDRALTAPAGTLRLITKSDTQDIANGVCRALLVGTAGTATIIDADGQESQNVPLQQGYNPIGVQRIKTGGTADNIWALY